MKLEHYFIGLIMKREQVKAVAVEMVKEAGLINLARRELCDRAGIPDGSFPHVMGSTFAEFVEELRNENIEQGMAPVSKRRAPAALRKEQLLDVAIDLAVEENYAKITRDSVAERAGVSMGLVTKYFGTMNQLKTEVMRAAVKRGIPSIIAQGLATGDSRAKKAAPELKEKAIALLANS
jgi:DNA-binding transcriptional regulator YbjK